MPRMNNGPMSRGEAFFIGLLLVVMVVLLFMIMSGAIKPTVTEYQCPRCGNWYTQNELVQTEDGRSWSYCCPHCNGEGVQVYWDREGHGWQTRTKG